MIPKLRIEILNSSLQKVAELKSFYPLSKQGTILRYSKELSDFGRCDFRIATKDPIFARLGDIFTPHKYHIRIKEDNNLLWHGAVVDNSQRNKNYWHIQGLEYEFYLSKALVKRTTEITAGTGFHYRIFNSGTMAAAVSAIVTEARDRFGAGHIMAGLTLGAIDNPNYPSSFMTIARNPLTGPWNFSSDVQLQFDYQSVLYVLKAFGIYSTSDFGFNDDLSFDFKDFIGNKQLNTVFKYGDRGNIVDYDVPRLGRRMANDLFGIAAQPDGTILHAEKRDENSIQQYGSMDDSQAYVDVKDSNALTQRLGEEIRLISSPDAAPINLIIDERSALTRGYGLGDIVSVDIADHGITFKGPRRVVGITTAVHNTGRRLVSVQTNKPRDEDLGI